MWQSSPTSFSTLQEWTTWWQMPSPGLQLWQALLVAPATRVPLKMVLDWREMERAQGTCMETLQATKSPSLQLLEQEVEGASLLGDISRGTWRPLVPASHRRVVFEACHNVAHPGTRATRRLLAARFVWPGMNADIGAWCRDCKACHRNKVTKHADAAQLS
jgi:hypothetical protein